MEEKQSEIESKLGELEDKMSVNMNTTDDSEDKPRARKRVVTSTLTVSCT